jgi:hypothetical protein
MATLLCFEFCWKELLRFAGRDDDRKAGLGYLWAGAYLLFIYIHLDQHGIYRDVAVVRHSGRIVKNDGGFLNSRVLCFYIDYVVRGHRPQSFGGRWPPSFLQLRVPVHDHVNGLGC